MALLGSELSFSLGESVEVALSAGVVVPLIVGTMDTTKSRLVAVSLVLVPISIGMVVIGRPFSSAAPEVWVPTASPSTRLYSVSRCTYLGEIGDWIDASRELLETLFPSPRQAR